MSTWSRAAAAARRAEAKRAEDKSYVRLHAAYAVINEHRAHKRDVIAWREERRAYYAEQDRIAAERQATRKAARKGGKRRRQITSRKGYCNA